MDVLEYLSPSTISDAVLYRSVAVAVATFQSEATHQRIVTGISAGAAALTTTTTNRTGVAADTVDASSHVTAPSVAGGSEHRIHLEPFSITQLAAALARVVPRSAAAVRTFITRNVPFLWKLSPPVLVPSAGPSLTRSGNNNHGSNNFLPASFWTSSPAMVALHPHRRVLAVAVPREGSSQHGAVLIYRVDESLSQPHQVLRSVLLKGICGVEWKPGSRNVLCVYGALGAVLFALSVDPETGEDVELRQQQSGRRDDFDDDDGNNSKNKRNTAGGAGRMMVAPSVGASNRRQQQQQNGGSSAQNLGVGCLYPVAEKLSQFGITPSIDRVAFFPEDGRLLACGSSESSGIRVVDVSAPPVMQIYKEWNDGDTASSGVVAGTFCGSPGGGTRDLLWLPRRGTREAPPAPIPGGAAAANTPPPPPAANRAVLLRAVAGVCAIEVFAAGVTHPLTQLNTELPVEQMLVSPWPLSSTISGSNVGGAAAGGGGNSASSADSALLRNIARGAAGKHQGVVGAALAANVLHDGANAANRPDRHVPIWLLYERCEGAVLTCLSFNETQLHRGSGEAPVFATNLLRVSTTAPPQAPPSHPGGRVSRIAIARESAVGARDSGTLLLSVESGHVIAVKFSRLAGASSTGAAAAFAAQTTMIVPTDEESSSEVAAELVGVFNNNGGVGPAAGDCFSFVTWNADDCTARVITATSNKTERAIAPGDMMAGPR